METFEELVLRLRVASYERAPGAPGSGKTGFLLAEAAARLREALASEGGDSVEADPYSGAVAPSYGSCPEEPAAESPAVEGGAGA